MRLNVAFTLSFSFLLAIFSASGQDSSVVAENGDGIFSLLRKSGIHPVKYYEKFLNLNEKNIRNGSELVVGETYVLPNAPDSFKNMGVRIVVDEGKEQPIFEQELSYMNLKDTTLQNTVYYLIQFSSLTDGKMKGSRNEGFVAIAKDLMLKGARVYILEDGQTNRETDTITSSELGDFTSAINKKYLKHKGAYQRVIVIQDHNTNTKNYTLAVKHYEQSEEGEKFAENLQNVFLKSGVTKKGVKNSSTEFRDKTSIFLAKNLLPPVTTISLNNISEITDTDIRMKAGKEKLPFMITKGILEDYSKLNFEE